MKKAPSKLLAYALSMLASAVLFSGCGSDDDDEQYYSGTVVGYSGSDLEVNMYELDADEEDLKGDKLGSSRVRNNGEFYDIEIEMGDDGPFIFEVVLDSSAKTQARGELPVLRAIVDDGRKRNNWVYITTATQLHSEMVAYDLSKREFKDPEDALVDMEALIREVLAPNLLSGVGLTSTSLVGDAEGADIAAEALVGHRLFLESLNNFIDWMHNKAADFNVDAPHADLITLLAEELADDDEFNGSIDKRLPTALANSDWHDDEIDEDGNTLDDIASIVATELDDNGFDDEADDVADVSVNGLSTNAGHPLILAISSDTDNDGIPNSQDEDMDGDGTLNVVDHFPSNPLEDTDTDGDGFGDNFETAAGTEADATLPVDTDGDKVPDAQDVSPTNPLVSIEIAAGCSSGAPDKTNVYGASMLDADWDSCAFWREVRKTHSDFDAATNMAVRQSESPCTIGSVSQAAIDRVTVVLNYTRALNNLKPIEHVAGPAADPDLFLQEMQWASLMGGGHTPISSNQGSTNCRNQLAEDGGSSSNLAGGNEETDPAKSIIQWINDRANSGGDPYTLGHRWHIVDPAEDYFSFGQGLAQLTMKVFGFDSKDTDGDYRYPDLVNADDNDGSLGLDGSALEYTAIPDGDYPFMMVEQGLTAWHFQVVNATAVDLTNAKVSIVPSSGGAALPLGLSTAYRPGEDEAPDADNIYRNTAQKAISFMPDGWHYDTSYSVEVTGIMVDGTAKTYSYTTKVLQAPILGYTGTAGVDNTVEGVISDINTELMWEDPDTLPTGAWTSAEAYCAGLTLAGESDWRLPSTDEFDSLAFVMTALEADGHADYLLADLGSENAEGKLYMWYNAQPQNGYYQAYDILSNAGIAGTQGTTGGGYPYRCVRNL